MPEPTNVQIVGIGTWADAEVTRAEDKAEENGK